MSTKKYQITQLKSGGTLDVLHPETDADIVAVATGTGAYQGEATNVQDALEEVYDMALSGGVTGVKGDAETDYRTGDVNITKANIGLGNVTNNAQVKGLASGTTSGHIVTWGADGYTVADSGKVFSTATPDSSSTDAQIPTAKAVWSAIEALPEPMIFKGTLGTGGTITTLPTAAATYEGYTYKVITAGTYATIAAKVGDVFVCANTGTAQNPAYSWILIPAGDDVEDTWRNIKVNGTELLGTGISTGAVNFKSGTGVTVSGSNNDVTVALADNYGDTKNPYASKTKNYVLAAPAAENGAPAFRALVASDIPDLSETYQPLDGDLTSIAGLSATSGVLMKTANNQWALNSISLTVKSGKNNASTPADITATASGTSTISLELADSGVGAGTYSAVKVNAKGIAIAGAQMIEVGTTATPSANLAEGGIFFKPLS